MGVMQRSALHVAPRRVHYWQGRRFMLNVGGTVGAACDRGAGGVKRPCGRRSRVGRGVGGDLPPIAMGVRGCNPRRKFLNFACKMLQSGSLCSVIYLFYNVNSTSRILGNVFRVADFTLMDRPYNKNVGGTCPPPSPRFLRLCT